MTIFWRGAFLAAFAAVCWLSLTPLDNLPPVPIWDKLAHGMVFSVLAVLARLGWKQLSIGRLAALLLAYGLLIEAAQLFVPGRSFSWLDLAADALGIAVYAIPASTLDRRRPAAGRP